MRKVVRNENNQAACRKCGSTSLTAKRSKKGLMAGGLMAPKRLKCQICGHLNKSG